MRHSDRSLAPWSLVIGMLAVVAVACAPPTSTLASAPPPPPPPSGPAPVISGFRCPVTGAVYTDSYGPRGTGFHWGIDMFKPLGTPAVAVKAGTVRDVPNEGAGGNVVYLTADDGNVYQLAHLNDFVGGDRRVAQGEIIGHVGQTGNATAVHLHFEIRIGGINGVRIDPYATLRGAGC